MSVKNKMICVIDSDPESEKIFSNILNPLGVILRFAKNEQDGIALINSFFPHIVVIGVNSKIESVDKNYFNARRANLILKQIPVIVCKENYIQGSAEMDKHKSILTISKPLKQTELIQAIKKLCQNIIPLQIDCKDNEASSIKLSIEGKMSHLSELNCIFQSPVKFIRNIKFNADVDFFRTNDINCNTFVTEDFCSVVDVGVYKTRCLSIGLSENSAQIIRSFRNKWTANEKK